MVVRIFGGCYIIRLAQYARKELGAALSGAGALALLLERELAVVPEFSTRAVPE